MAKVVFVSQGYEHIGLEALSAALKQRGHESFLVFDPVLFNETGFLVQPFLGRLFNMMDKLVMQVTQEEPDLIAFSVISDNCNWARRWCRSLKMHTAIPIVWGGIHPTIVPDYVIAEPDVDYVCVGEGDDALIDLVEAIAEKKSTYSIPNIWAKEVSGHVHKNDPRPLINNLDSLPFVDKDLYSKSAPIFDDGYSIAATRGCPFSCSFCGNNALQKRYAFHLQPYYRSRSVSHVIEELMLAKERFNPRFIAFCDDAFAVDPLWREDFCAQYTQKVQLPFSCFVTPHVVDEVFVRSMKSAGCFKMQMGVQTVREGVRETLLKRTYSNERIRTNIALMKKYDIHVVCDNILGLPYHTEDDMVELARFYETEMPSLIELFWLRYYPGTELLAHAHDEGLVSEKEYQAIMQGTVSTGIVRGGERRSARSLQLHLMMNIFHCIPHWVRRWLVNGGYWFLPIISSSVQLIVFRIIFCLMRKSPRYDLNLSRTVKKYKYYMKKTLCSYVEKRVTFRRAYSAKSSIAIGDSVA